MTPGAEHINPISTLPSGGERIPLEQRNKERLGKGTDVDKRAQGTRADSVSGGGSAWPLFGSRKSPPGPHLEPENQRLSAENRKLEKELEVANQGLGKLRAAEEKFASEHRENSDLKRLVDDLRTQNNQYQGWLDTASSNVQRLEAENRAYEKQVATMSKIVSQLSKRGLPVAEDDNYFHETFNSLISDIRQWARLLTRGQKPLTFDLINTIGRDPVTEEQLKSFFPDISHWIRSQNLGSKVRVRCVEIILLQTLFGASLYGPSMYRFGSGIMSAQNHIYHDHLFGSIGGTDEETRSWSALTVHLLSKKVEAKSWQAEQEGLLTEDLYKRTGPFGEFNKNATKQRLHEIVCRVAALRVIMARLPYTIEPLDVRPGASFDELSMEDVELDVEEETPGRETTVILSPPWIKVTSDEEGRKTYGLQNQWTYITKARVSCIKWNLETKTPSEDMDCSAAGDTELEGLEAQPEEADCMQFNQ